MRMGGLEILVVFIVVMLFFGPKQIPKLTGVIKDSIADFKKGEGSGDGDGGQHVEQGQDAAASGDKPAGAA